MLFHRVSTEKDHEKQKVIYPQNGDSQEIATYMGYESGQKKRIMVASTKENRNTFFWCDAVQEPAEAGMVRQLTSLIP